MNDDEQRKSWFHNFQREATDKVLARPVGQYRNQLSSGQFFHRVKGVAGGLLAFSIFIFLILPQQKRVEFLQFSVQQLGTAAENVDKQIQKFFGGE